MKELLIDYLVGTAVALTSPVILFFVSRHAGFWPRLRNWRSWAKGPDSWAPCVMIPLILTMLSIVADLPPTFVPPVMLVRQARGQGRQARGPRAPAAGSPESCVV